MSKIDTRYNLVRKLVATGQAWLNPEVYKRSESVYTCSGLEESTWHRLRSKDGDMQ